MRTIRFDRKCLSWCIDDDKNKHFIQIEIDWLNSMLKYSGYLYANTIYETFGIPWSPWDENVCYRDVNECFIGFNKITDGVYEIYLHH